MSSSIRMYNQYRNQMKPGESVLGKALDSSSPGGGPLIREHLQTVLTNTVTRLSPIMNLVTPTYDPKKIHEFNKITELPKGGGAMGENSITPTRNSVMERDATVALKIQKHKGQVSGFLQDATEGELQAMAVEIENQLITHVNDLNFYSLWGNKDANQYEHDGWDKSITTNRIVEASAGVIPTNLDFLDQMISNNTRRQGKPHKKAFLMSPEMADKVSSLLTNVRNNQDSGRPGLPMIEIGGGWHLESYRNIPIIETTFTRPTSTMTAVVATASASGGALADDQYFFRVAPVTFEGEQLASAEVNDTVSGGGGAGKVDLTFTAFPGAIQYNIYGGLVTGVANTPLIKVVSAFDFDINGTITGDKASISITTMSPGVDVPTAMQTQVCKIGTGGVPAEDVFLIDLDQFQGMGEYSYTNKKGDRFRGIVTFKPLAETDDASPFLLKTYGAVVPAYEATSSVHKNLRTK